MELNVLSKSEIKQGLLECADILLVPGGFYRWMKREDKETGDMSSKLERNLIKYAITPGMEALKLGNYCLAGELA